MRIKLKHFPRAWKQRIDSQYPHLLEGYDMGRKSESWIHTLYYHLKLPFHLPMNSIPDPIQPRGIEASPVLESIFLHWKTKQD